MGWILTIVLPVASWIVDKAFGGYAWTLVRAWGRRLRRVQRVDLPADNAAFEQAFDRLLALLPRELRYSRSYMKDWIAPPQSSMGPTILILERDWRRRLRGVLFASVYKGPPARCMVTHIMPIQSLDEHQALEVMTRLWTELRRFTLRATALERCAYYFEVVLPDGNPPAHEREVARRAQYLAFLDSVGATVVTTPLIMFDKSAELSAILAHRTDFEARVAYLDPEGRHGWRPNNSEVLDFVYGVDYWWALQWWEAAGDMTTIKLIIRYLDRLAGRVRRSQSS